MRWSKILLFFLCISTKSVHLKEPDNDYKIDLTDFDKLELQSLNQLNRDRAMRGLQKVNLSEELNVMAHNEANRLANQSRIDPFNFDTSRKLFVQLFRLVGKNHRGERIGLKKCYNFNDELFKLDFDQVLHVDEACRAVEKSRPVSLNLINEFGFGRAFDTARNATLYHVRLFYYSHKLESVNSTNSEDSVTEEFQKYGKLSGLKFLKIN
jgi:hypothetical protein